jgi:hypothetical protein
MNRYTGPFEIADLVAWAERSKRNREIILRTDCPRKPPTPQGLRSVTISPKISLDAYLHALDIDAEP